MIVLWIKAAHIIAMVAWFAGLFYLPRLFVYHSECKDSLSEQTFRVMEMRLFFWIMTPAGLLTLITGLALLDQYAWAAYRTTGWLQAKLFLVLLLMVFHGLCYFWLRQFREGRNKRSARFFRIVNEFPTLVLIATVILVVVKPF